MKKINSNLFNLQFFLSDKTKVNSLEVGAEKFGGATKFDDNIYSNIAGNEYILLNENINTLSIFIPSTFEADQKIDNKYYITEVLNQLRKEYNLSNIKFYDTVGSWYSDDLKKVIIEDITILTVELEKIEEKDIYNFVDVATWIKKEMKQEAVSINLNSALCII